MLASLQKRLVNGERWKGKGEVAKEQMVFIIDDDQRVGSSLTNFLESVGIQSQFFRSVREYTESHKPDVATCLLLDIELPDVNGLEFQRQLAGMYHPPIIFMTGYGDIPSAVQAMKAGAIDFLAKPLMHQRLIASIQEAFAQHDKARIKLAEKEELRRRYARLTPREREVLVLVVSGLLNKQAAAELGISVVTCQVHRGQIMRKMAAGSLAELVRMAGKLEIPLPAAFDAAI